MLSPSCQYAIRAVEHLALRPCGALTPGKDIAEAADVPRPYLWKILGRLVQAGIVRSHKGASGGMSWHDPHAI